MSFKEDSSETKHGSEPRAGGSCSRLYDLLRMEKSAKWVDRDLREWNDSSTGPRERLESLLNEGGNKFCADCGSPDPKWVSFNIGSVICIKCSGVHRSLGVHISKVLSVKLDEWTHEQVDALIEMGGNTAVNMKYEANIPENYRKPETDSSAEDRTDFIRRKYEKHQFLNCNLPLSFPYPGASSSNCNSSNEKKNNDKQSTSHRMQGLGHVFRSSRKRAAKKSNSMAGMIEFVGLIKVNIVRGKNLAVRDMVTSDPYVILALGNQSVKTRVIKSSLNPVWNECLMLSIPDTIPPLKLLVYDKDTFSTDDFMGSAEIDIQPLLSAAKASESSSLCESTLLGEWKASHEKTLMDDGIISLEDGKVKLETSIKLQNVERGVLEIELECMPLTQ